MCVHISIRNIWSPATQYPPAMKRYISHCRGEFGRIILFPPIMISHPCSTCTVTIMCSLLSVWLSIPRWGSQIGSQIDGRKARWIFWTPRHGPSPSSMPSSISMSYSTDLKGVEILGLLGHSGLWKSGSFPASGWKRGIWTLEFGDFYQQLLFQ